MPSFIWTQSTPFRIRIYGPQEKIEGEQKSITPSPERKGPPPVLKSTKKS
jgi:hypothetical protein